MNRFAERLDMRCERVRAGVRKTEVFGLNNGLNEYSGKNYSGGSYWETDCEESRLDCVKWVMSARHRGIII